MYLRYLLFAPVSLFFNIFCMITSPVWALWAALFKLTKLPGPFAWVHTHDDWVYGFYAEKPYPPKKFIDRFKAACKWICRNPGYTFDAQVLGFPGEGKMTIKVENPDAKFDTGESVKRFEVMKAANGKTYFSYRRDFKLGKGRFMKTWFGWQHRTQAGYHILKFDINPFKTVKK